MTTVYTKQNVPHSKSILLLIWHAFLKRKILLFSLIFFIILLPILYLVIRYQPKIEAAWYDDTFAYRQRVDITNAGTAQTDFQVAITLNTSALITAGKMQSDCDDIRVTDVNGKVLPIWIETGTNACNTTTTAIWTKVPTISTTGTTVFLYYGNGSATNAQNGNNVFIYFDDFNDYSLGALPSGGKWTWESSVVSPTIVDDSGAKSLRLAPQSSGEGPMLFNQGTVSNTVIHARVRDANNAHYHIGRHSNLSSPVGDTGQGFWIYPGNINLYRNNAGYNSWSSISSASRAVSLTTYHNYKVTANGSSWAIYEDGAGSPTHSGTEGTYSSGYPSLLTYAGENMYVDFFFVRTFAATEPTVASPTNEEKSQGPIAYWKFDEGNGTTANDSSGKGKTGTFLSAPLWKTEDLCVSGKCLAFDNVDDGVSIANENFTSLTDYTMCAWINPKGNHKNYTGTIMSSGDWNNTHWAFGINQTNTQIQTRKADGVNYPVWNYTIPLSQWTYVCLTRANTIVTAYVNGIQIGSPYTGTTGNLISNATNTTIGRETYAGGYFDFNGSIDEPKIYNYSRTAAQIKADYAAKSSGSVKGVSAQMGTNVRNSDAFSNGLVGYWKMDEAAANTCSGGVNDSCDSSGNGRDGAWNGNVTSSAGKFGNGTVYDGSADYLTITNTNLINVSQGTVSLWVKPNAGSTANYFIFSHPQTATNSRVYMYTNAAGTILAGLLGNGTEIGNVGITASTWHHVTLSWNGTQAKFYIDGVDSTTTSTFNGLTDTAATLYLGSFTGGESLNGSIDEVRIYNRSLSPKEVRDLYDWAPGPYTYLTFDEGTGNNIYDVSGNGYSGAWNGSGTHWTSGKFGSAAKFDGSTDYISFSSLPKTTNLPVTIEFWTRPTSLTPVGIFDSAPGIGDVLRNYSSGAVEWWAGAPSVSLGLTANQWTHLAFTFSYSAGTQYIEWYKNGVKQTTGSAAGDGAWAWTTFRLGNINGGSAGWYSGDLDEFKIYNYARSSKQIVEDMNAGHPAGGSPVGSQVGYWRFDEGYGSTVNNQISGQPNFVLASAPNDPSWDNNGKSDKAVYFDGALSVATEDYANATFTAQTWDDGTLSMWIKPDSIPASEYYPISNYNGVVGEDGGWLVAISSNGGCSIRGNSSYNDTCPANTFQVNQWIHFVWVVSKTQGFTKIYANGKLIYTNSSNTLGFRINTTLRAGMGSWCGTGNDCIYPGFLDNVKLYNTALNENEIKLDYNQGSALVLGAKIEDTNDNPVGYWKLDETNGTTVNNYGSCSTCGGTSASITYGGGKINGSYDMQPSSTDYWYAPANAALDVDSRFTVEAWGTYDASGRYGLFANNTVENQFNAYISGTAVAVLGTTLSGGAVAAGQWFHTAVTYDGTSYRLYVNGILVSTDSTTGVRDFSGCWVFGQEVDGAGLCTSGFDSAQAWDGKIDEVKIYNYVRSSEQIKADAATDTFNPSLPGAPVAEWKLDENTGANAYDTSGNGNTGTLGGSASWTTGNVGAALKFSDSTDDKVTFSNSILNTPPYTVCAWVKPDSITDGDYHYVIANGGESGGLYGFFIYLNNTGTWLFGVKNSSGLTGSASIAATNTNWTYVCGTWDGTSTSGAVKLYVNGSLAPTGTAAGTSAVSAANLKIGGASSTDAYNWDGKIDHVKIYNYVRTPAQIAYDYNRGGPVGYWRMDECQGGTAYDSSGNGNNGTITIGGTGTQTAVGTCTTAGTAWGNGVNGKYNNSLNFDGSDDMVEIPYNSKLDLPIFTVSAWVKPNGVQTGYPAIITDVYPSKVNYTIRFNNGTLDVYGGIYLSGWYNTPTATLTDSVWSNVVFSYDGSNLTLYVNGVSKGSTAASITPSSSGTGIRIGRRWDTTDYVKGQIDDVKIFNYALSAEQVKNLYNAGAGVQFAPVTGTP